MFDRLPAEKTADGSGQSLYGGTVPTRGTTEFEALQYKAQAVKILNQWLNDPVQSLSNDAFAAVVRLLTFEV